MAKIVRQEDVRRDLWTGRENTGIKNRVSRRFGEKQDEHAMLKKGTEPRDRM